MFSVVSGIRILFPYGFIARDLCFLLDLWLNKEYWHHLHNFPLHNELPYEAESRLMDALIYGGVCECPTITPKK